MISLSTIFPTLVARRRAFGLAFIMIVAIGLAVIWRLPDKFAASASLVFVGSADPMRATGGPASTPPVIYLTTQVDILRSDRIASAAVNRVADEVQHRLKEMHASTGSKEPFERWVAEFVQRRTSVQFSRDSNLVELVFRASDPEIAAAIANAIVDSFVDTTVDLRGQAAEQYEKAYGRQTDVARKRLMEVQAALQSYQRKNKVLISDNRLDAESARLAELSSKTGNMRAAAEDARLRESQARQRGGDRPPSASEDKVWAELAHREQLVDAEIAEVSRRLGSAHPSYVDLVSKRSAVRAALREHRSRLMSDVTAQRMLAEQQLRIAEKMEAEQRAKLTEIGELQAGAASLERDLRAAQQAYDQLLEAMQESGIQAQSKVGDVSVLERAQVPTEPASPNRTLFAFALILLASAGAAIVALAREMLDPRVRGADHLAKISEFPLPIVVPNFNLGARPLSVRRSRALLGTGKAG